MKTSQHQFDLLVSYMEQHGDLSKPTLNARGRVVALQNWEELTSLLNSDGSGDTKTTEKWKKVWSDYKNNIKKKAARLHRAALGTGGGPAILSKLTDIEQRVLNLIGVQVATGLAIPEAGFSQEIVQLHEEPQHDVQVEIEIDLLNEPGTSKQLPCVPGPSSEHHRDFSSQIHSVQRSNPNEPRPPSQTDVEPLSLRPVVSPSIINEEPIENISGLACSPHHTAAASEHPTQPSQFGQTTPRRRSRPSRVRLSPGNQPSPRRRMIPQRRQSEQAAQHFLESDAEWRAFRMQQHSDYINLRREQNRIRELEVQMQRDWQAVGLRAIDILDKLVNKFCS